MNQIRQQLRARREKHRKALEQEAGRLAQAAAAMGAELVVLFGSTAHDDAGLASDFDLLIV